MDLLTEFHLRIVEEVLLDEDLVEQKIHLHHYNTKLNEALETSLFHKACHYYSDEVIRDRASKRKSYQKDTKRPYRPVFLTCKALSDTLFKIYDARSLYFIHHQPFPRGIDDSGPFGPRRRFTPEALERIRRASVVSQFHQERTGPTGDRPASRAPLDPFYENVRSIFSLFGPVFQAKYPRAREISFQIEMIDWQIKNLGTFDAQFVIPHVTALTISIRGSALPESEFSIHISKLKNILTQFPSFAKLYIEWIRPQSYIWKGQATDPKAKLIVYSREFVLVLDDVVHRDRDHLLFEESMMMDDIRRLLTRNCAQGCRKLFASEEQLMVGSPRSRCIFSTWFVFTN